MAEAAERGSVRMVEKAKQPKKEEAKYGDTFLEMIAPDIQMLKIVEEIQHQNRMILEAFAQPRIVVHKSGETDKS